MTIGHPRPLDLPALVAALLLACLACPPCGAGAQPGPAALPPRGDLLIPGGVAGLYRAVNLPPPRDRAYSLLDLARALYQDAGDSNLIVEPRAGQLREYLEVLALWSIRLAPFGGRVSLENSRDGNSRERLRALLEYVGMDLREAGGVIRIGRNDDPEGARRRAVLAGAGVGVDGVDERLNAGGSVDLALPGDTVPLPLARSTWLRAVFGQRVPPEALFAAVTGNRDALWLYCGLTALDDETLSFLEATPDLLASMYRDRAALFARFGPSVRVRHGRVETPGGARDAWIWESLVGAKTTDAARFVQRLFARDTGRLASFYDAVAHLDAGRQAAAMGASVAGGSAREAAVRALYASFAAFCPPCDISTQPFARHLFDPPLALNLLALTPEGRVAGPPWAVFWDLAFATGSLPGRAPDSFQTLERSQPVTLASLVGHIFQGLPADQRARSDLVLFAGRVFRPVDAAHAFDALVALRGFGRFPALMLVLERIGVHEPAVYAEAARAAEAVSAPAEASVVAVRTVSFQAAVALLDRLREVHSLDADVATRLARSLFTIRPAQEGWYRGAVARWVEREVLPAVSGAGDAGQMESRMMSALSGAWATPDRAGPVIEWEGHRYRVDVGHGTLRRLLQVREKQGGPDLDQVLALWRVAAALEAGTERLDDLPGTRATLEAASGGLGPLAATTLLGPDPPDAAKIVPRALEGLAGLTRKEDLERLPGIAQPLLQLVDRATAEWLASVAYAVRIEDVDASVLLGSNPALHHDLLRRPGDDERLPWSVPVQSQRASARAHLEGSLVGLDLPLARHAIIRLSTGPPPHPPTVKAIDSANFIASLSLLNPFEVTDEGRDAVAAAVRRGRARVGALATDPGAWPSVAATLPADAWERQLVPWMIANEPDRVAARFSAFDLFVLGRGATASDVDRWGMPLLPLDGSLSVGLPERRLRSVLTGRSNTGVLATQLPDLNLRIAEFLADAHLPAALAHGMLAAALPDFLADALLVHDDDWPALAASARALRQERLEHYVSALTADGPLVPVERQPGAAAGAPFRPSSPRPRWSP
jgi:hypothetical protein